MVTAGRRPYRLVVVKAGVEFVTRTEYRNEDTAVADGRGYVASGWDTAWVRTAAGADLYRIEIPRKEAGCGR
ncbi:hypothetical protein ABZ671_18960 [Micromonospora sp. NPDC006766]|uniref:hypothetical protein n=1 Tax=Micromonospora sp. NPDC006766 TaxID=3154778 RepID=UPI0033D7FD22